MCCLLIRKNTLHVPIHKSQLSGRQSGAEACDVTHSLRYILCRIGRHSGGRYSYRPVNQTHFKGAALKCLIDCIKIRHLSAIDTSHPIHLCNNITHVNDLKKSFTIRLAPTVGTRLVV